MAWLHSWVGLLAGWVLFFVFLTGTFGYVNVEVDRWMRPERPMPAAAPPPAESLGLAERRLLDVAPEAESWVIVLPGGRGGADLSVRWRAYPSNGKSGRETRENLDSRTGLPLQSIDRETGGGITLYVMHYALHYLPAQWAYYIVGICTMFMLVAIMSGIVVHKKIFADFFTFRSGKGQRSWLDGHNLLAVTSLPFHLMITWSGLLFFLFLYMPTAMEMLYPAGAARNAFINDVYGIEPAGHSGTHAAAPMTPLTGLLPQVERRWRAGAGIVEVTNPGRDTARVTVYAHETGVSRIIPSLQFDGVTGALLRENEGGVAIPSAFISLLLGLHEGRFAEPLLRALYVLAGLGGTAMIGAGLVLWSVKRKAKLPQEGRGSHVGIALVDALNMATILGLPIAIAGYFWANRLLPVAMADRAAWEVNAMFMVWGLTFIYAAWRCRRGGWRDLSWLAAVAYGGLPLVNAATTGRHLAVSLPASDWAFAGFDLAALGIGLAFAALARALGRRDRWVAR